jgi:prevent-host-death family protein
MVMSTSAEPEVRISAAEFKAKCLQLIDDAHERKQAVVVTKRGVPMARLVPFEQPEKPAFRSIVGRTPGIKILGDIVSPLPQEWTLPEWARESPEKSSKKKKKK